MSAGPVPEQASGRGERFVYRHEPVLGTVVEFRIGAATPEIADRADARMLAEIDRLSGLFSVYDDGSELNRWQRGEADPGPELSALLTDSLHWQRTSGGAYNPAVGVLTKRWARAASEDREPSSAELADLAASIAEPPYRCTDGRIETIGDLSALSFNSFAKGRIADLAAAAGSEVDGVDDVTVNAGGDLAHRGPTPVSVGIEDPARPYDNVAPLAVVWLRSSAGLATSGNSRRGFRVGGRWFGHLLDPRTARPIDDPRSVSVIAPDAATADVVATIVAVLGVPAGAAFAAPLDRVGWLIVRADGSVSSDERWAASRRR